MNHFRHEHESPPNGNGTGLSGLPIWARVVVVIGVPSAIAIFLVWIGANYVPAIARQVDMNHTEIVLLRQQMDSHKTQSDATYRLLQRICSNTSKSEYERQKCFD